MPSVQRICCSDQILSRSPIGSDALAKPNGCADPARPSPFYPTVLPTGQTETLLDKASCGLVLVGYEAARISLQAIPVLQKKMKKEDLKSITWNLALITAGSLLCALAINGILVPQQFLAGSITGLALLIHYTWPKLSVGILYFLLNIPIYALGWKYVGRRFFLYSVAGLLIFSGAVELIHFRIPVEDRFLSALLAGIISGTGSGIILRSRGSAGGLDILSIIFMKLYSVRIGSSILAFNAGLLTIAALLFSIEASLYALIFIFVSSRLVDLVVTGLSQRKLVMIISESWQEIEQFILQRLNRGVTRVHGEGGYSRRQGTILYSVITFHELSRLKRAIREIDPQAFVVITDTLEVMGLRIGNQPHW